IAPDRAADQPNLFEQLAVGFIQNPFIAFLPVNTRRSWGRIFSTNDSSAHKQFQTTVSIDIGQSQRTSTAELTWYCCCRVHIAKEQFMLQHRRRVDRKSV